MFHLELVINVAREIPSADSAVTSHEGKPGTGSSGSLAP